jgi:hypothetical protein
MCFDGGSSDNSAQIAREREVERQKRVFEGTNRINQVFGGDLYKEVPYQELVQGTGGQQLLGDDWVDIPAQSQTKTRQEKAGTAPANSATTSIPA